MNGYILFDLFGTSLCALAGLGAVSAGLVEGDFDAFSPRKDYDDILTRSSKNNYDMPPIKAINSWADGDRLSQSPAYRAAGYSPRDNTSVF